MEERRVKTGGVAVLRDTMGRHIYDVSIFCPAG